MSSVEERIRRLMPREARWAYWQDKGGPMFVYNTERIHQRYPSAAEGKFESTVYVPYGPGSRSGKATRWREAEGARSMHDLRRDAKARAYRLFLHWLETGKVDV